jgi:enamine deaminase RidA (YjgF/YER057c/UK114 family)
MVDENLKKLGIVIPPASPPLFNYVAVTIHNGVAYVAGHIPREGTNILFTGKLGGDITLDQGKEAARVCIVQALSSLQGALGNLNRVEQVLKMVGFVASAPGFVDQPKVIDAASDLIVAIFGDKGRHARSAIGVAELPRGVPVEIELIVAVK